MSGICGKTMEVFSRVVGYYRPIQNWNIGKKQEFKDRVPYDAKKINGDLKTGIES